MRRVKSIVEQVPIGRLGLLAGVKIVRHPEVNDVKTPGNIFLETGGTLPGLVAVLFHIPSDMVVISSPGNESGEGTSYPK